MPRNLRISICAYSPGITPLPECSVTKRVEQALELVRQAAHEGANLAVLPEAFAMHAIEQWPEQAETLDGQVLGTLAAEAKRLGIGIAAGHVTKEDGKLYNSVVLLDREGSVAAAYHKTFPTIWELEVGITPGSGARTFDSEFGRIGFAICYDLNFAELRLAYRDQNPDLILFCSAFRGGLQTRWWAYETRSYVVSSCIGPKSLMVNPLGRSIAETDLMTRIVNRTINLDYEVLHYDYTMQSLAGISRTYGGEFEFEWAEPEGVMLVSSTGSEPVRSLIDATGLETVEQYLARARRLREQSLTGLPVQKQSSEVRSSDR